MPRAYSVSITNQHGETLKIEGGHSFDEVYKELERAVADRNALLSMREGKVGGVVGVTPPAPVIEPTGEPHPAPNKAIKK